MNYPTSKGKNGLIYTIADGVKVIPNKAGYWTLDIYEKGERHRRNFEKGEDGLKRAITAAELYAAKVGLSSTKGSKEERLLRQHFPMWHQSGSKPTARAGLTGQMNVMLQSFAISSTPSWA